MTETLHTKYRPNSFDEVVGHDAVVKALRSNLDKLRSQSFIFSGPPGCGKTTLARIMANYVGCDALNLVEVDAATFTGIDAMRTLTNTAAFTPLGKAKARVFIVDEAHRLSSQAWASLLKSIEEPNDGIYWAFCTTELSKVPKNIQSRCVKITVPKLGVSALKQIINTVCDSEDIDLDPDIQTLIINKADGSARELLVALSLVSECETKAQARSLLQELSETETEVIDLAKSLVKGDKWATVAKQLQALTVEPESCRIIITNYVGSFVLNSGTSDRKLQHLLGILEAFNEPFDPTCKKVPLILACAQSLGV